MKQTPFLCLRVMLLYGEVITLRNAQLYAGAVVGRGNVGNGEAGTAAIVLVENFERAREQAQACARVAIGALDAPRVVALSVVGHLKRKLVGGEHGDVDVNGTLGTEGGKGML